MRVWGRVTTTGSVLLGLLLVTATMAGPVTAAVAGQEQRAVGAEDAVASQDDDGGTVVQGDGPPDCVTGDRLTGNEIADGYIGLTCGTENGQPTLTFFMSGGFAYMIVVEVPDDAPSRGLAAKQGEYENWGPGRTDAELDPIWEQVNPLMDDEVGVTYQTPTLRKQAFRTTERLPPGVYNVRVVAYEGPVYEWAPEDASYDAVQYREQAPKHSSTLRIEVGDCAVDPSPEAKLERLDRRKLELIEDIAQLRDLYAKERAKFAAGTAAATVSFSYEVLTGAKAVAKKGAEEGLKAAAGEAAERGGKGFESQLMTDAPTPPSPPGLADIREKVTDPAWERRNEIINRYHARTKELKRVNEEYSRTVERVRRCAGVTVPPSYQGVTAAERQRAKAPNGWPYNDGTEGNPYDDLGDPARHGDTTPRAADGGR
jgi:hypothetical protein